jgi:hypothetical protein
MTQIRHKLEPEPSRPQYFITEPGLGFRFEVPEPVEDGDDVEDEGIGGDG